MLQNKLSSQQEKYNETIHYDKRGEKSREIENITTERLFFNFRTGHVSLTPTLVHFSST
jgi:hypothetical protein